MQTLGDILRAAREKEGISVKDVEKATSIGAIYIQAIEDGKYSVLPGEVYLKGFIRNYANFLGLNGQEMVNLYRQSQIPPTEIPAEPVKNERKAQSSGGGSAGKWMVGLVVIGVLVGGGWLGLSYLNAPEPSSPPPKPAPQTQAPPVQPPPLAVQTPTTPATPAAPAAKPVVIVASFSGPSWALVSADGKNVYEGIPKTGESFTWNADRNITIKLGNAGNVSLTLNGQPQGKQGGDGEVIEKTFSATTTNIQKP
ncbi:MAG: helix-turn-helix domain-containing protein [Negativicutes bacterium]|nr:helix-turn-helix domain-containing protein [Negativicutes bacterium]